MSINSFKKTGRNLEVNRDELISLTVEYLKKYDSMNSEQKYKLSNPYTDPINTKISNGKLIQIPQYIQKIAIDKWNIWATSRFLLTFACTIVGQLGFPVALGGQPCQINTH